LKKQRKADTRRFARFHVLEYALIFSPEGFEPIRSVVVDVGLGGLQVLARKQYPVGDVCSLQIGKADGSRIMVPGQVRFSQPMNGSGLFQTGLRFVPETHEQKSEVVEYVHRIFQRQADMLAG
jgi:hypothetical protein